VAVILLSPLASGITGEVNYVDKGMHVMGVAMDSPAFAKE
jgi:enoyl-[acyl-carrier protein] reductase I